MKKFIKSIEKYGFTYFVFSFVALVFSLKLEDTWEYKPFSCVFGIICICFLMLILFFIVKNLFKDIRK